LKYGQRLVEHPRIRAVADASPAVASVCLTKQA